ncbi:MAG: class I SAM-dependent methyltransferase [Candidatus Hodarchaeota archaeon]
MNFIDFGNTPFTKSSETGAHPIRLNWRCEILLTRNKQAIEGKRILDLASHDGRFSYACLKLGAKHVIGVEARKHLVNHSKKNLDNLGYKSKEFEIIQDDIFNYLPNVEKGKFDTILCFGIFYHTIKQIELLKEIKRIKPKYLILDTLVETMFNKKKSKGKQISKNLFRTFKYIWKQKFKVINLNFKELILKIKNLVIKRTLRNLMNEKSIGLVFRYEDHKIEGHTIESNNIVAYPTKIFIEYLFKKLGFKFKRLYWDKKEIKNWDKLLDYKNGKRISYIAQLF